MSAGVLVGVAIGGACGALARFGVSEAARGLGESWAWGTFTVNVLGCAMIGVLIALLLTPEGAPRWEASPAVRAAVLVGFVGSFTTFSTYAWEALEMASRGHTLRAGVYLLASNAFGLAAVWVGWKVFARVASHAGS